MGVEFVNSNTVSVSSGILSPDGHADQLQRRHQGPDWRHVLDDEPRRSASQRSQCPNERRDHHHRRCERGYAEHVVGRRALNPEFQRRLGSITIRNGRNQTVSSLTNAGSVTVGANSTLTASGYVQAGERPPSPPPTRSWWPRAARAVSRSPGARSSGSGSSRVRGPGLSLSGTGTISPGLAGIGKLSVTGSLRPDRRNPGDRAQRHRGRSVDTLSAPVGLARRHARHHHGVCGRALGDSGHDHHRGVDLGPLHRRDRSRSSGVTSPTRSRSTPRTSSCVSFDPTSPCRTSRSARATWAPRT